MDAVRYPRVVGTAGDALVKPFASVTMIGPGQFVLSLVSNPGGLRREQMMVMNTEEFYRVVQAAVNALDVQRE